MMLGRLRMKNKEHVLMIFLMIFTVGLLIIGGTYAYLAYGANVTNGKYNTRVECFKVNYDIGNEDNTQNITGTLFPSKDALGGLSGRVSLAIDSSCDVTGEGKLYIHINDATSTELLKTVAGHCENSLTLETIADKKDSETCTAQTNGSWVTNGTGIKYAVFSSGNTTGSPLKKGYITQSDIGTDIEVYSGFTVSEVISKFDIYVWQDGYVTDETYAGLPFSGYIHAEVVQNNQ